MNVIQLPLAIIWLVFGMVRIDGTSGGQPGAQPPAYYGFGGQPVTLELAVETPKGEPVDIQADLFQRAQTLLAPVQKDIVVAQALNASGFAPYRPLVSWKMPLPAVTRETQMLARFRVRTGAADWQPAGQVLLTVYPPDFAKEELARVAKDPGLRVFGGDALRKFLKAQKTDFEDVGSDLASLPPSPEDKNLYIGEATSRQLAQWLTANPAWQGSLVVFCTDTPLLPGVFVTTQGGLRLAKVTLPMLDTLSTDPRSQKTLVEVLKSVTP
ncbi:MAG: hypothetical protein PHQ12_00555 [Chthoniobacteraceae bacterium]|nr:hypothetical protein [Chthoniobacteraceae bacterium]